MEGLVMSRDFWRGKKVFLTGHTGFKGGWLALWLTDMGAIVYGYALAPPTSTNFFTLCKLKSSLADHTEADIRNPDLLTKALQQSQAEIVFHLAAQPLVRHSYEDPVETYVTNVIGTVNLLEAVRKTSTVKAVLNITTDKCYENKEWVWPYRENEALGGYDPYSSSKACSELVTASYRDSFLKKMGVYVASARAGNVIGGGDWAKDRLIPDFLWSINENETLTIRSPLAIRPWQHVLEPLSGYLKLAEKLYCEGDIFAEAWNFGPDDADARSVEWIVKYLCQKTANANWQCDTRTQPHEAHTLKLDSSKAKAKLDWSPRWDLGVALSHTLSWHQSWKEGENMKAVSISQVKEYESRI